jgi:hypothetical protein
VGVAEDLARADGGLPVLADGRGELFELGAVRSAVSKVSVDVLPPRVISIFEPTLSARKGASREILPSSPTISIRSRRAEEMLQGTMPNSESNSSTLASSLSAPSSSNRAKAEAL